MKTYFNLTRKKDLKGLLFISPWIIGFLMFFLDPIIQTFIYSLNDIKIGDSGVIKTFTGFSNYIDAFTKDATFPIILSASFRSLMTDVPVILIFSFLVAVVLNQKFRGSVIFKTIFFISIVLSAGVFLRLQMQVAGTNNAQLGQVLSDNREVASFLDNIRIEKYLIEMGVPQNFISLMVGPMQRVFVIITRSGLQIFIFLSGLYGIPSSLYEAANVEGATGWESFWKITFPILSPLILVNIIYSIVDSFMNIDNPVLNYIYRRTFYDTQFGYASALAWIYSIIVSVVLIIIGILISKRVFYYD